MGRLKTHLFISDERKLFTGDILTKFDDTSRYVISAFHSRDEFLRSIKARQERRSCIIAIVGAGEVPEQAAVFVETLRNVNHIKGIILLCPSDKTEEIRRSVALSSEMCIPQNTNSVLRVHNIVKKIFSEHTINIYRKRRNRSVIVLGISLALAAILLIAAIIEYPHYF